MTSIAFLLIFIAFTAFSRIQGNKKAGSFDEEHPITHHNLKDEEFYIYAYQYLDSHFTFFSELEKIEQHKFINRMIDFIKEKRIIGMEDVMIDNECLVLVSMPAIRITFGLHDYLLPNLKTIGIYPTIFYNNFIQQEAKGLTFVTGVTYLSLEHLKHGNENAYDNLNLGLHEMGHSFKLYVESISDPFSNLPSRMESFIYHAEAMLELIEDGRLDYLRDYAGTNTDEFFAVCIENFFEKPYDFRTAMPNTYQKLAKMLNQFPAG